MIATREATMDGTALIRLLEDHAVTVLQATPATWRLMLEAGWKGSPRLKALCGGEALPPSLAAELLKRCGELWNMYGPTETTIWSTCGRILDANDISIGRPIDNTEVRVVDHTFGCVPVGVTGELMIGGDGLAVGYLNRPELTAERFVMDPGRPGKRLYRTGDLARWRPDGTLECLGRMDSQVKIRGHRIELGEIETVLVTHEKVGEAVVTSQRRGTGDSHLVAHVVRRGNFDPSSDELREHLARRLPAYMIPSAFASSNSCR
ncbi:MAG: AMP-binding protein [Verrucomicrobia bacterium]|nr:AMP-binding protein [Verrucomicrobiota bacterium]